MELKKLLASVGSLAAGMISFTSPAQAFVLFEFAGRVELPAGNLACYVKPDGAFYSQSELPDAVEDGKVLGDFKGINPRAVIEEEFGAGQCINQQKPPCICDNPANCQCQ